MSEKRNEVAFLPGVAGDRALVSRLVAGEEDAFRECYQMHAPALMRILIRVVRNQAVAEEIVQETFVAAFRTIGQFRGETRFSTWLAGIALRRGLNSLRGDSRREKHLPPLPEASPSAEPWLVERDTTRRVLALLDEMEPEKKMALLLQAEGYTAAEIAEMSQEPRGTILSRLARGRAELAQKAAAAGLVVDWQKKEGRS